MLRFWVLREINSRFCSKTQWQIFLLVSGRHVGAHLGGHQHGVSIQISINLGKTFARISSIRKIAVTWILARVFAYLPSFYFRIMDLIYWTVSIFFILIYFEWRDTENQQYAETYHVGGGGGISLLDLWLKPPFSNSSGVVWKTLIVEFVSKLRHWMFQFEKHHSQRRNKALPWQRVYLQIDWISCTDSLNLF